MGKGGEKKKEEQAVKAGKKYQIAAALAERAAHYPVYRAVKWGRSDLSW